MFFFVNSNKFMNFALLIETCLACFFVYTPYVNTVILLRPIR